MIITTLHGESDVRVQTITVSHSLHEPRRAFLFHCFRCGNPIAQIQGIITRIFPGLIPHAGVTVMQKCRMCGELYTFQTSDNRRTIQPVRVVLSTQKINNDFICPLSVTPLLQFNAGGIVLLPEFVRQEIPFIVSCPRKGCAGKYRVVDLI